jgi:hypothetical protein
VAAPFVPPLAADVLPLEPVELPLMAAEPCVAEALCPDVAAAPVALAAVRPPTPAPLAAAPVADVLVGFAVAGVPVAGWVEESAGGLLLQPAARHIHKPASRAVCMRHSLLSILGFTFSRRFACAFSAMSALASADRVKRHGAHRKHAFTTAQPAQLRLATRAPAARSVRRRWDFARSAAPPVPIFKKATHCRTRALPDISHRVGAGRSRTGTRTTRVCELSDRPRTREIALCCAT